MAHLLGSKNCLDSLSKDIMSMQDCINGILSNTGQMEYASWKYPSKNASSLDVNELIEDYSYCKSDEDSNKLSHIILFELVIDRFCLLLQSVSEMFDSVVTAASYDDISFRPPSRTVTNTMSVGLITKLFWKKICDVHLSFASIEKENLEYNQALMNLENTLLELKIENEKLKRNKSAKVRKKSESEEKSSTNLSVDETNVENKDILISNDNSVFTQTAFVPCEECSSMQENLIKGGSEVISICESQGLPSSLSKQKKLVKNSQMSLSDISRWSCEEERDLKKINQHLTTLQSQVGELQKQLSEEKIAKTKISNDFNIVIAERDQLKKVVNTLQEENEKQCKNISESNEYINTSKGENIKLTDENHNLNELNKKVSEELERYKQSSHTLEQGMNSLTTQLDLQKDINEKLIESQHELSQIRLKLKETDGKLNETTEKHDKLKAENRVLLKHDQSLQTKQANLLSRIEKLDETCENLVVQLGENEEEVEKLTDDNIKKDDEIKQLREEIRIQCELVDKLQKQFNNAVHDISTGNETALKSEKDSLKEELERLNHNLRLVVCYPVIGSDYKNLEEDYKSIINNPKNQFDCDSDVIVDMENQINGNSARIGILDTQNYSLRNSLLKLEHANAGVKENVVPPRSSTSNNQCIAKELNRKQSHSATERVISKESIVIPRPPSEPRASSKLSRPWSGKKEKKESFNIGATLANLDRLKNATSMKKFDWSADVSAKTAWQENDSDSPAKSFICPDCDKTYLSDRDLDIHKNFCYGRLK